MVDNCWFLEHNFKILRFADSWPFFPEEIYPSVSCKLNWWKRLIKKKLVTSFCNSCFSNMSQIFLAFVDHIWEFLALQAVCLFLPKELSQQSVFFDIAKQTFGDICTPFWEIFCFAGSWPIFPKEIESAISFFRHFKTSIWHCFR